MRLGIAIANDTSRFFEDLLGDLKSYYQVDAFKQRYVKAPFFYYRINQTLFDHDLTTFLRNHEVVFFEWASQLLVAATHLPKRCGIVTRLHRYEMFTWADKVNWEAVDRVILVSQAMKRRFVDQFPTHEKKTIVLPVGVATDKYRPTGKPFRGDIGTLCHLSPRKRVYELILAFYKINQQRNDLHLHIAGGREDGYDDYYDALQSLVQRLDLENKVTFYGDITDAQNWYRNIDIFISNSYSEGLQVAPMEAMASGCYTLSHRWDGAEELLPEANLFFTDDELEDKILIYCDASETERRRHQQSMRSIVCDNFDVRQVKHQIREIIEEVAQLQNNASSRTLWRGQSRVAGES